MVDAVSGEPIEKPVFRVRELPEHQVLGWGPYLAVRPSSDHLVFVAEYTFNAIHCTPPRDTMLPLTLVVGDSLGRHASVSHSSSWHFQCTSNPPDDVTPLPYPNETGLTIRLEPR